MSDAETRAEDFDLSSLVAEVAEKACRLEPVISVVLQDLADANGGRLEDLDTRFKTEESIARKMGDRLRQNPRISEGRLKRSINDALRYTVVTDAQGYADAVQEVLAGLENADYEFTEKDIRNSWPEDDLYKGINCTLRTRGGIDQFEVQFHTEESLQAKHEAHTLYEQRRSRETSPEDRAELDGRMRELFGRILVPPNVGEIGRRVVRLR